MSGLDLNKLNNSNSGQNIFSFSTNNLPINKDNLLFDRNGKNSENLNKKQKKIAQFILGKKLGNGAFAVVRLATHIKTNEIVAIKILEKEKMKEINKIRLEREIKILKKVRHRNIVNLYNVVNSKTSIYLIMEYIKGIELFSYVNEKNRLTEPEACRYFQQIISGLEYLEKLKIVHRDIKLENIIIDNNKNVKIIDFGLSNIYPKTNILFSSCGSPCYAPPEMIMGINYTGSGTDIWSSGVVLFAMISGYLPFMDLDEKKLYKKILEGKLYFPQCISELARDLLKNLLNKDPLKRITIDKIKKHPWFQLINPKITMTPGLIIDEIITPIDLDIVNLMVNTYDYNETEIKIDLLRNKHNYTTTTYYILLDAKIKKGEKSISDMKSKEFLNYIKNPSNFLSNYYYDIDKVIEEKIYKNEKTKSERKIRSCNNSPRNLSLTININSLSKNNFKKKFNSKIFRTHYNTKACQIRDKNDDSDIDNNEEYICDNDDDFEVIDKPIKNEIRSKKKTNSNWKLRQKSKKRNLKKIMKDKNDKLIANTMYFKKKLKTLFESKTKYQNKKDNSIKKNNNLNINIINDDNFIKEKMKKEHLFNNFEQIKNKKNLNNKKNHSISVTKTNENTNNTNIKKNRIKNKSKENSNKETEDNNNLLKNEKIKVNSININEQKLISKKLLNKKTEPININNRTFGHKQNFKADVTKNNDIESPYKKLLNNIGKNQTFKNQKKINKNRTINITESNENNKINKKIDQNNAKKLITFENDSFNSNLKEKKVHSKKLYVNLKNKKELNLEKIKKGKSISKKNFEINKIDCNNRNEKNNFKNNLNDKDNYYYKKMKTIDLRIKELEQNRNKENQKEASNLSSYNKTITNKKKLEGRVLILKKENRSLEKSQQNNKRLDTDTEKSFKSFDSKILNEKIKINKKRNIISKDNKNKNNTITYIKINDMTDEENTLLKKKSPFDIKINLKKTNKKENGKKKVNKDVINETNAFLPFNLNKNIRINNIENTFALVNDYLKNNQINYTKLKNKYMCFIKTTKFEIIFDKIYGYDNLYKLKINVKNNTNKQINEIIGNIIKIIS